MSLVCECTTDSLDSPLIIEFKFGSCVVESYTTIPIYSNILLCHRYTERALFQILNYV